MGKIYDLMDDRSLPKEFLVDYDVIMDRVVKCYRDEYGFSDDFIRRYITNRPNKVNVKNIVNKDTDENYFRPILSDKFLNLKINASSSDLEVLIDNIELFSEIEVIKASFIDISDLIKLYNQGYKGIVDVDIVAFDFSKSYSDDFKCLEIVGYNRIVVYIKNSPVIEIQDNKLALSHTNVIPIDDVMKVAKTVEKIDLARINIHLDSIYFINNTSYENDITLVWALLVCLMEKLDVKNLTINKADIKEINLYNKYTCSKIKVLNIKDNKFNSLDKVIKLFPNLQHLNCSNNQLDEYQKIENDNLKSLSISYTDRLKTSSIDYTNLISLSKLEIHGRSIKSIKLHDDIELTELNISNTSIGKNPLSYLPSKFIFDYTPLVNEDVFINTVMEANIEYSCLPRIVFDVEEDKGHKLPNYAFLKKKKVENAMYSDFTNDILKTLDYSNALHSEYSTNIDNKLNENKLDKRYSWITIDGKWGNGKSYYFKNFAVPLLEESEYEITTISSISLLTSNVYMSIIEELGYKEKVFDSIERIIHINIDGYKFFLKLYILFCLMLITLFIWNVNNNGEQLTGLINYIAVMVSVAIIPSMYFFTESISKQNTIQKREQQSIDNFLLKFNEYNKKILIIDDIERCTVDTQMSIINALAKFNENIHIILIADIKELKNAISSNYSTETEYSAFISKYVDLNIDFDNKIDENHKITYFDEKYHFKNIKLKNNLIRLIAQSETLSTVSIRELDQNLIWAMNECEESFFSSYDESYFYIKLIELISSKQHISKNNYEICVFLDLYRLIFDTNNELLIRYALYSFDELFIYSAERTRSELGTILSHSDTKEDFLNEIYGLHLKNYSNYAYFNVNEFIQRYENSEFEHILWKRILIKEYPSLSSNNDIVFNPNRAIIRSFICDYNYQRLPRIKHRKEKGE